MVCVDVQKSICPILNCVIWGWPDWRSSERNAETSFGTILLAPEALSVLKRPERFEATLSTSERSSLLKSLYLSGGESARGPNTLWAILICEHNSTFRSGFTLVRIKKLERGRRPDNKHVGKTMRTHRESETPRQSRIASS